MSLLQRTRVLSQQRIDLPDYRNIEDFVCADFKAIFKNAWTGENFVLSGFNATGTGTSDLSVALAGSTAIFGKDDGVMYIGAPSLSALQTDALTPSATNFVEIFIEQDTGGADSRAFWDQTAAAGQGGEFSQIVDTFIFIKATFAINTSSFTGDADKLPICEVDVDPGGNITEIRDSRDGMFRLGRASNSLFAFPWGSRTEPVSTSFTGADKDIATLKQWFDAVMSRIRENAGTTYWYESPAISLVGSFRHDLAILAGLTNTARFAWSGTDLSITDASGTPLDTDDLGTIRLFDSTADLHLTRQDSGNSIALNDGEVLWVELPDPLANVTYDGVGLTSSNYRVSARGSVPLQDTTYWLAYREGTKIYLRGLGELEAGEERQITDETTTALLTFLGFDPETATSVPYTAVPDSLIFGNLFDTSDSLVTAISTNTANINALGTVIDENAYAEKLTVVSGAPADDNEITGPVSASSTLTLPLDSRDGNAVEEYIVGDGILKLFLNGQLLCEGEDYNEIGAIGTLSSTVEILLNLPIGDRIQFRIDSLGGFNVGAAGGGGDVIGGSNVGTGAGESFKQKVAGILEFRKIKAGAGINVITSGDDIIISLTGGTPEPYFRNDITGVTTALVGVGGTYNLGTDKLDVYRNGVLMHESASIGLPVERYEEATSTQVLLGLAGVAAEVFTFVNQSDTPVYKNILTGLTGTILTVPAYTQGNDSLRVWRNGILMNAATLGAAVDQYSETSPTSITLAQAAVASDIFVVENGPIPSFREDLTGLTGTLVTLSSSYTIGSDELLIYKNGVLMLNSTTLANPVDRYQETSSTTVTMEVALTATDVITAINK